MTESGAASASKFQVPGTCNALSVRQTPDIALQHHLEGLSLRDESERHLDFLNLVADAGQPAGNLSHGQKQWLEIGMATSLRPKLLLLDEPTAGMSPEET
jgi:branched-chain amino acid transport system ATP-binding protein